MCTQRYLLILPSAILLFTDTDWLTTSVLKQESEFALGLNTAKCTHYIKNCYKSCFELLATGHNCRIASVAALEGDAQYFIIWNIGDWIQL